jgi:FdhD protein
MRRAAVDTTVTEWRDGSVTDRADALAGEEPLEIRVNGQPVSVTMRTPGEDVELALGFLFTEGLIRGPGDLAGAGPLTASATCNVIDVRLAPGVTIDTGRLTRHFFASSSCGLCGKATIDAVRARHLRPLDDRLRIGAELLCDLPGALRPAQEVFESTGGLHAAALFDRQGRLAAVREDVGRHNAVDKIVGWALAAGRLPLEDAVLLVSGRGGFEIVQKAIAARVPVVASISAPSSLAVSLAREMNQTLVGFLRGRRFLIYSGPHRVAGSGRRAALAAGAVAAAE